MKYYICAIAKNEHLYLEEWLSHHLSIGFDEITIIEDYESLSHKSITDKFPSDKVHLIPASEHFNSLQNKGESGWKRQMRAYNKFIYNHKSDNAWVAFIDIDEYIMIDEGETLDSIVSYLDECGYNSVAIFWKCYNANGHITRPKEGIVKSYTHYIDASNTKSSKYKQNFFSLYKAFVKLDNNFTCFSHDVHTTDRLTDIDGVPVTLYDRDVTRDPKYDKLHINHYFTKSWEDWCVRISRGNMHVGIRNYREFFDLNPDLDKFKSTLLKIIK